MRQPGRLRSDRSLSRLSDQRSGRMMVSRGRLRMLEGRASARVSYAWMHTPLGAATPYFPGGPSLRNLFYWLPGANQYTLGGLMSSPPAEYSPTEDSVVRRQAHTLRQKLQEHDG